MVQLVQQVFLETVKHLVHLVLQVQQELVVQLVQQVTLEQVV